MEKRYICEIYSFDEKKREYYRGRFKVDTIEEAENKVSFFFPCEDIKLKLYTREEYDQLDERRRRILSALGNTVFISVTVFVMFLFLALVLFTVTAVTSIMIFAAAYAMEDSRKKF